METQQTYKCAAMRSPGPARYTMPSMSEQYRTDLIWALVAAENSLCGDRAFPSEHVAAIRTFREELEGMLPDMKF